MATYKQHTNGHQQYILIPDQAFLYFPSKEQIIQEQGKHYHRIIFDGNIGYIRQQMRVIKELKQQMQKKQKNNQIRHYKDNTLLRFLQANKNNIQDCIKSLRQYKLWQNMNLPLKITHQISNLLKQGVLYMCGRDCCYRPILVVNVGKILQLAPKTKLFYDTLGYFFQYVIQNTLIEGQVENWVTIIDLGNASVFSLGGTLSDTIKYLSSTFRGRVHHSYLLNAPSSINFLWGMVKGALTQDQVKKLSLSSNQHLLKENFAQINECQIQKKYGGTHPDIKHYWPFNVTDRKIETPKTRLSNLISRQQYKKKYDHKQLQNRKINKRLLTQHSKHSLSSIHEISQQNENNLTRSRIQQDLDQLNLKIPKQRPTPNVPQIPQSNSFRALLNQFFNKFF